ncbi:MAG: ATP-binding protein [Candidatus Gygaella obscura]|nr:ATP-binding protein [Candidatus Gygaella obscura]
MTQRKTGVKRKIILFVVFTGICISVFSLILSFIIASRSIRQEAGKNFSKTAFIVARYVNDILMQEVEELRMHLTSPMWHQAITDQNLSYRGKPQEEITEILKANDIEWFKANKDSSFLKSYLDSSLGKRLKRLIDADKNTLEIFLTDRYGGLVAASSKTSDFYQADEAWWQKAYNNGKGAVVIEDISFDESVGQMTLDIAVPYVGNGEVLGVCKTVLNIQQIFSTLETLPFLDTSYVSIVKKSGLVVFYKNIKPLSMHIISGDIIPQWLESNKFTGVLKENIHNNKILASIRKLNNPILSQNGVEWYVLYGKDFKAVFFPQSDLIFGMILAFLLAVSLTVPLGYFLGNIFIKPIHKLHIATEKIIDGDWNFSLDINTNDEIEQFSDVFKEMVNRLKGQHQETNKSKVKFEELSKLLEEKVKERTKELTDAQDASLNILEDLTEAKDKLDKYAKELEKAIKIKSEFTSMVSHELRTPLAAIKEGVSIVYDEEAGKISSEQKEFLEIAKRNVDRLARLINDVLDFSKLEVGKIDFNIKENNINEVVQEIQNTMIPVASAKGLAIEVDIQKDLLFINFDRDKVVQVLTNLVNNAIKFTDKGKITLSTRSKGDVLLVSVRDTGKGIKEQNIPKLFQQFEQLEKGSERKTGGTGLGLAISKQIIKAHNGNIWAESKLGEGTVVSFTLPIGE